VRPISKTEMLREILDEDTHPLLEFRHYLKSTEDGSYILRFDNGFGALVNLERETVTPIAWRNDARSIKEYYDVSETIYNTTFEHLQIVQGWKHSPPPF
jgi:hypothetical protein